MAEQQSYPDPDLVLIAELLEDIDRHPPGHQARVLLMQHYKRCGWYDQARQEALQIIAISPSDLEAQATLQETHDHDIRAAKPTTKKSSQAPEWRPEQTSIPSTAKALQELSTGYTLLISRAASLRQNLSVLQQLGGPELQEAKSGLTAITTGRLIEFVRPEPIEGVSAVAATVLADARQGADAALDTMLKHLEGLARRLSGPQQDPMASANSSNGSGYSDAVRELLVERASALKALLPETLLPMADSAVMHMDHEILKRKYVNDTTMLFDPVSSIPRANFLITEDGYAWDMEELAAAIRSGNGIMRNPLSKHMFSRADIRTIIHHPLGNGLQALQIEQSSMKQGVRPDTITQLESLSKTLLSDMSADGKPTRIAAEEFSAYIETLPAREQKVVDRLKIPAKDSHTGINFDRTIGATVEDLQGNRVCSHKAGDFFGQAAKYLRQDEEEEEEE